MFKVTELKWWWWWPEIALMPQQHDIGMNNALSSCQNLAQQSAVVFALLVSKKLNLLNTWAFKEPHFSNLSYPHAVQLLILLLARVTPQSSQSVITCFWDLFIQVFPLTLFPFCILSRFYPIQIELLCRKTSLMIVSISFFFQLLSVFTHTLLCGTSHIYFPIHECLCIILFDSSPANLLCKFLSTFLRKEMTNIYETPILC